MHQQKLVLWVLLISLALGGAATVVVLAQRKPPAPVSETPGRQHLEALTKQPGSPLNPDTPRPAATPTPAPSMPAPATPTPKAPPAATGQTRRSAQGMPDLNLTEAQQAKVRAIRDTAMAKVEAIRADTTLSDDQKRAQAQAVMQESWKQTDAVLTPEQRDQLQQFRRERSQNGSMGGVTFTDEQRAKMETIRQTYEPKLAAIREDTTLSEEERRAKQRELRAQMVAEVRAILTPEQQQQLDAMRQRWQNGGNRPEGGARRGADSSGG